MVKRIPPFSISEAELFSQLPQAMGPVLFLGRYTLEDVVERLERSGLLPGLVQKGIKHPQVVLQPHKEDEHRLYILDEAATTTILLVELRLSLTKLIHPDPIDIVHEAESHQMLSANWVLLQNPYESFSEEKPALPGQEHPGLGLGRKCHQFLARLAGELHCDGVLNYPQFYHNALFYRDEYFFLDPAQQGQLMAMIRDLSKYPVHVASRAIAEGKLKDVHQDRLLEWSPEVMVCPLQEELRRYFESRNYRGIVEQAMQSQEFDLAI